MNVSLSDGEWKLMNRLWEHAPRTITELTAALREETGWSKNTIITMLSRLEAKGAVTHTEGQRAKQYSPLILREDAAREETESFLSKVYGGCRGRDRRPEEGRSSVLSSSTESTTPSSSVP